MPIPEDFAGADTQLVVTCTLLNGVTVSAHRSLQDLRTAVLSADVLRRRGKVCQEAHQEAAAAVWFERILAAPIPDNIDAYDDALRFLVKASDPALRDPARAITLGNVLVARTRGLDARTWYMLALAHQQLGHRAEAERAATSALALRPGHPAILTVLDAVRAMPPP